MQEKYRSDEISTISIVLLQFWVIKSTVYEYNDHENVN